MTVNTRRVATTLLSVFLLASLFLATPAPAQQKPETLAQQSAEAWLAFTDSGKYPDSWQQASQLFKNAVTQEQWQSAMHANREPLGKLVSRKLRSAKYMTELPGAPDGEYVVIQFDSSFEHKQSAVETVTPMIDKDGKWRVSGYYIK